MALSRIPCFMNCHKIWATQKLSFSTSYCFNNSWRLKQGLEGNPNKYGPLTNLPDFSYVDGRPVPLSYHKRQKLALQKKYCEKISELSYEMDFALKLYEKKQQEKEATKKEILANKLKPKGVALQKKKQ